MEPDVGRTPHRLRHYNAFGTGAVVGGALLYIGLNDPHRPGSWFPPCPFKMLTGWDCPACGGLRMTHDLLHGNVAAAITDNVFLLTALPLLAVWALWRLRRGEGLLSPVAGALVVVAALAWTVLRNLPGFPLVPTILDG